MEAILSIHMLYKAEMNRWKTILVSTPAQTMIFQINRSTAPAGVLLCMHCMLAGCAGYFRGEMPQSPMRRRGGGGGEGGGGSGLKKSSWQAANNPGSRHAMEPTNRGSSPLVSLHMASPKRRTTAVPALHCTRIVA